MKENHRAHREHGERKKCAFRASVSSVLSVVIYPIYNQMPESISARSYIVMNPIGGIC